jgi:hypothetical protein
MPKKIRILKKELWNLDSTLSDIIHQYLVAFKNAERLGILYSHDFEKPGFKMMGEDGMPTGYSNDTEWFLDELIWTFKTLSEGGVDSIPEVEAMIEEVFGHDGAMSFSDDEEHLGYSVVSFRIDEEKNKQLRALEEKLQERITKGLALFAKYFQALWD